VEKRVPSMTLGAALRIRWREVVVVALVLVAMRPTGVLLGILSVPAARLLRTRRPTIWLGRAAALWVGRSPLWIRGATLRLGRAFTLPLRRCAVALFLGLFATALKVGFGASAPLTPVLGCGVAFSCAVAAAFDLTRRLGGLR
jgi:hypothetical protein